LRALCYFLGSTVACVNNAKKGLKNMSEKTKNVKIDENLYNQVDDLAKDIYLPVERLLSILVLKGVISVKENGIAVEEMCLKPVKTDKEFLLYLGEKKAKKGKDALDIWLSSLTDKERNDVKYSISSWRKIAK